MDRVEPRVDTSRRANVNANNNNKRNKSKTGCQKEPALSACDLIRYCCPIAVARMQMRLLLPLSPISFCSSLFPFLSLSLFLSLWASARYHQPATTICHLPLNFHRQQLEPIPAACSPFAYLFVASCRYALKYPAWRGALHKFITDLTAL